MNKIISLVAFSILITFLFTACSKRADGTRKIPFVYRVDIQQGNVIDQSMVNKLEAGMSKAKVRFIMGTPLLVDPFHSHRWDYIYSLEPGDSEREQRRLSVFFEDDKLIHLEGDITPVYAHTIVDNSNTSSDIVVPAYRKKKGFFSRLFDSEEEQNEEGFFSKWFGSEDEIKKADETRDEETEKELEALADDVNKRSEDSILPIPERNAEQIERDFKVLEQTEDSL